MLKKLFLNLLLLGVVCTLGLVGMEYAVRFILPGYNPAGHIRYLDGKGDLPALGPANQTLRQYKNAGDFDVMVRFNAYGLRDGKDLVNAGADDWFAVGDSYTLGHGVEEDQRYTNLLEKAIGKPVYNIAIPGDFNQYAKLLAYARSKGAHIQNLIVGVCMENDLIAYNEVQTNQPQASVAGQFHASLLHQAKAWMLSKSALYVLFTSSVYRVPVLKNAFIKAGLLTPNEEGVMRTAFNPAIVEQSANRLAEVVAGIPHVVVLIIPSRGLWIPAYAATADQYHQAFVAALRARGMTVADPRPLFDALPNPLQTHFFANDGHWNAAGHRLGVEALVQAIQK